MGIKRLPGVCASATKERLGRWAEPGGGVAFGHSLGLVIVNQACLASEVRAKGTLGTKLRGGGTGKGGGLRSKQWRDLGVSHCTIRLWQASVRHSCSRDRPSPALSPRPPLPPPPPRDRCSPAPPSPALPLSLLLPPPHPEPPPPAHP